MIGYSYKFDFMNEPAAFKFLNCKLMEVFNQIGLYALSAIYYDCVYDWNSNENY